MNSFHERTQAHRIREVFAFLRRRGRTALIPYIMAGDPDLETTAALIGELGMGGADLVEVGVPFSDPMADGPVIQQAAGRALAAGTTLAAVLECIAGLHCQGDCRPSLPPIVLMTYFNPVYRYGVRRFAADAARAGVAGVIVPDLPLEEAAELREAAAGAGLDVIPLLAPTSTEDRIAAAAATAPGFIYCVSLTGVTGARAEISGRLASLVAGVRRQTGIPLAAGFGISAPEQAVAAAGLADGVVIGSALVNALAGAQGGKATTARRFIAEYRKALDGAVLRQYPAGRGCLMVP